MIYTVALGFISINGKYACISIYALVETDSPKGFCFGGKAAIICPFSSMEIELCSLSQCSICHAQQKKGSLLKTQIKLYFIFVIKSLVAHGHVLLLLFTTCYLEFMLYYQLWLVIDPSERGRLPSSSLPCQRGRNGSSLVGILNREASHK